MRNRLDPQVRVEDSWTCRRAMDGQRCVHCILQSCVGKGENGRNALHLRTRDHRWMVMMHQHNIRTISTIANYKSGYIDTLEQMLLFQAAQKHGRSNHQTICFRPSMRLKHLKALRKRTTNPRSRNMWSLQIWNFHRREVRARKTGQFKMFFNTASRRKDLRNFLQKFIGKHIVVQPHEMFLHACWRSCFVPQTVWLSLWGLTVVAERRGVLEVANGFRRKYYVFDVRFSW